MTRRQDCTAFNDPNHRYSMAERLEQENRQKSDCELLFSPHRVEDISADPALRKLGVDFLLHLDLPGYIGSPIRCENKFEQMATGRADYELVSVDRPRKVPGWLFTSTAAWVLSWFPSGEMVAVHMDELRKVILPYPERFKSTTTRNKTYLTWNVLPDISYVLSRCTSARWVDLRFELGADYSKPPMLAARHGLQRCSSEQLTELMAQMPAASVPIPVTDAELTSAMLAMAPNNFRARVHAEQIQRLGLMTRH